MRRLALVFLVLFAASLSLLSGCSLYDPSVGDNIGPFVDPANNPLGDFLPSENAQKTIDLSISVPPEEDEKIDEDDGDGIEIIDENHTRLNKPPIVEVNEDGAVAYFFDGGKFMFQVPFLWRKTMVVDVVTGSDEDYEVSDYIFYYVPENQSSEPPREAKVMALSVAERDYFLKYGHGPDGISATEGKDSGEWVFTYMKPSEEQQLPADFPDIDGYLNIIKVLVNNWDFRVVDTAE
ncbi:MAG: hypothetical protein FWE66_02970 [Oscillospiraceae bacterium]|nr:hypothetical protein [Oscillospiraceae bacterium]